jgi:hypothetical protein
VKSLQVDEVNIEIEKLLKLPPRLTRLDTSSQFAWRGRKRSGETRYSLRWVSISPAEPAQGVIVATQNLEYFIEVVQRVLDLRKKKPCISTVVHKLRKRATA